MAANDGNKTVIVAIFGQFLVFSKDCCCIVYVMSVVKYVSDSQALCPYNSGILFKYSDSAFVSLTNVGMRK